MRLKNHFLTILAFLTLMTGCEREKDDEAFSVSLLPRFGVTIDDLHSPDSKSVLPVSIETRISDITLAAYSTADGSLIESRYFTDDFDRMELDLASETAATVYALVNMGDMTEAYPSNNSEIGLIQYTIPSYTGGAGSIEERGIPMAGKTAWEASSRSVIPIQRLLAKVTVELKLHWPGTLQTVQIRNMNRHLVPFGESRAEGISDVFSEEIATGNNLSEGSFVFYIPENRQGAIGAITDSKDKGKDNANILPKADVLTYLEVTAAGADTHSGTMVYRSYLGENATCDFSIKRNCRYTWKVDYLRDGTYVNDWKHENNLSWSQFRYNLSTSPFYQNEQQKTLYIGSSVSLYLTRVEDRYEKGVLKKAGNSSQQIDTRLADWSHENWTTPNFLFLSEILDSGNTHARIYMANLTGQGYIRATITDEWGTFSDRVFIYCEGPVPSMVLTVSPTNVKVGETVLFNTKVDGMDVTSAIDYYRIIYNEEEHDDYFHNYIDQDGRWTLMASEAFPEVTGTYTVQSFYQEGGHTDYLASNIVSFTVSKADEIAYALSVEPAEPPAAMVGENISLHAYLDTYTNGSRTAHDDVTTEAGWSCLDECVSIVDGFVTSSMPGTFSIQAAFEAPDGKEKTAAVNVSFTGDTRYILLSATPNHFQEGENCHVKVLFNGTEDVTAGSSITAYTEETGHTVSSIVSLSGATITGVTPGECFLEATYETGGKTFVSQRVKLTVSAIPVIPSPSLDLDWSSEGKPSYVGQRGKPVLTGLADGETLQEFTASPEGRIRLEKEAGEWYAALLTPGECILTATTSEGRSISLSETISAPEIRPNTDKVYANPDGSVAHTENDGLNGSLFTAEYAAGSQPFSLTAGPIAVGNQLYQPLYEELLALQYASSSDILHSGKDGIWVNQLSGYPVQDGKKIGTVTLEAKKTSAGVAKCAIDVLSVNPFRLWNAQVTKAKDVEDWTLLEEYCAKESDTSEGSVDTPSIIATPSLCGFTVFAGETEAGDAFKHLFQWNGGEVTWNIGPDEFKALPVHVGAQVSLQATVTNSHSHERLFHPFATFSITVHGAVGADTRLLIEEPTGKFKYMHVMAALVGDPIGTPFYEGLFKVGSTIERNESFDHNLGTFPYIVTNTTQMQIQYGTEGNYVLEVYPAVMTNGQYYPSNDRFVFSDTQAFMMTTSPCLKWGDILNHGRVRQVGNELHIDSFYILHLLEDIQTLKLVNGNKGWIN